MRVLGAAALLSAVMADGAAAQAPPTLGGGRLPAVKSPTSYRPTVMLALQPRGARIAMLFDSTVKCGRQVTSVLGSDEAAWNGSSFRFSGRSSEPYGSGRLKTRWTVKGQLTGDVARGILHITGTTRSHRCRRKPDRPFTVRIAGPRTGAPAQPPARAFYIGTSSRELFDHIQAPVALRVSTDARKVASQWTMDAKCGKGAPEHFVNFTPGMRIRADGTFSRSERFKIRFSDAVVRYHPSFAGRITADGASGTLRLRARIYTRSGKKLVTRCDSGVVSWNAAPA
jgi:hypothetical protein